MSNDYLELRKAASRTTPFARKQARGQASAVTDALFSPVGGADLLGPLPVTAYAGSEGISMTAPRKTQVDAMAAPDFVLNELRTPANAPFVAGPRMLARAGSSFVENLPTQLDDFYSGNPLKKAKGMFKGTAQATGAAASELLSPLTMATRREVGTGPVRTREFDVAKGAEGKTNVGSIREGNIKASAALRSQATGAGVGQGDTLIDSFPMLKRDAVEVGRLENPSDIKKALTADNPDLPEDVVNRATNHLLESQGREGQLVTRNRATSGTALGPEAIGQATTSPVGLRTLYNPKRMESWYDVVGENPSTEQWKEMLGLFSAFERDFLLQNKKVFGDTPPGKIWDSYWQAKKNQKTGSSLGKQQQKIVQTIEKQMKKQTGLRKYLSKVIPNALMKPSGPTTVREMNGKLVLQQSFASATKDLGGMNAFIVVDPKKGEFYSMLSDGHDLMGATPVGYEDLVNVLPIQKYKIGGGKEAGGARPKAELEASTKVFEDTSELERRSRMPRQKGESSTAYQRRVMRDFRGTPTAREDLEALMNMGMAASTAGMLTGSREER